MLSNLLDIDIFTLFIKSYCMNIFMYYCFNKTLTIDRRIKKHKQFLILNVIIAIMYIVLKQHVNSILSLIILYLVTSIIITSISKNKFGYTITMVIISYALCNVFLIFSGIIVFQLYKSICNENELVSVILTMIVQFILVAAFFKIKRFKNGFASIYDKFDKDIVDTVVIYLSIVLVLIACFMGCVFFEPEDIMKNTIITFIILGITMYIMIQRTITMQYKHSLLLKTLEEYKEDIENKNKEIEKLSAEKFNTSKIRHEFYNRQKALELMVKQNVVGTINTEGISENILSIVNELTTEYSKECEIVKGLAPLPETDVVEIDNMFKYMQTECAKNNIEFKLNIQDSIHPLINNHISKNRLETLLGDHIRNAINVLNKTEIDNKEILVVLGLKDGNYEICILDNGLEFKIDVLLKLGKEQVTTGGTGIGFITTFETLKETKASLVIAELEPGEYTKSISFVFDNKSLYVINSHRADKIKKLNNREDIIINKLEG